MCIVCSPQPPLIMRLGYDLDDGRLPRAGKGLPFTGLLLIWTCICLFRDCATKRNAHFPGDKVPDDVLATDNHQTLPLATSACTATKLRWQLFGCWHSTRCLVLSTVLVSRSQIARKSGLVTWLQLRSVVVLPGDNIMRGVRGTYHGYCSADNLFTCTPASFM